MPGSRFTELLRSQSVGRKTSLAQALLIGGHASGAVGGRELDAAVARTMAREREERYQTMSELVRALRPHGAGLAPSSQPLLGESVKRKPHPVEPRRSVGPSDDAPTETLLGSDLHIPPQSRHENGTRREESSAIESCVIPEGPANRASPRWKHLIWYLVTLPLAWFLFIPAVLVPAGVLGALGLDESLPSALGIAVGVFICGALTFASMRLTEFWGRQRWSRWLQGPGFGEWTKSKKQLQIAHVIQLSTFAAIDASRFTNTNLA